MKKLLGKFSCFAIVYNCLDMLFNFYKLQQKEVMIQNLLNEKKLRNQICIQIAKVQQAKGAEASIFSAFISIASSAKIDSIEKWHITKILYTRDGLKNWKESIHEIRDSNGATLLHISCKATGIVSETKRLHFIQYLIEKLQFDIQAIDLTGKKTLHYAAINGFNNICLYLIKKGADPYYEDYAGYNALQYVKTLSKPSEKVIQILLEEMKNNRLLYIQRNPLKNHPNLDKIVKREIWFYVILIKGRTQEIPGILASLDKGSSKINIIMENKIKNNSNENHFLDSSKSIEDRIIVGNEEYNIIDVNQTDSLILLDHERQGPSIKNGKIYVSGGYNLNYDIPTLKVVSMVERIPGNPSDVSSPEQEFWQDSQLKGLGEPDSMKEIALKFGPFVDKAGATAVMNEWNIRNKTLLIEKRCISESKCCDHFCLQKKGLSYCLDSMIKNATIIATETLGRSKLARIMKPRVLVEKKQDKYLKKYTEWPGSPSKEVKKSVSMLKADIAQPIFED